MECVNSYVYLYNFTKRLESMCVMLREKFQISSARFAASSMQSLQSVQLIHVDNPIC